MGNKNAKVKKNVNFDQFNQFNRNLFKNDFY